MIISAIIYKQYLNAPVLFVIDETLANLDLDTTSLVCNAIKKIFADSIVLSVDHNARHNQDFYTDLIDLADFKPVEVMGVLLKKLRNSSLPTLDIKHSIDITQV
ncbi:MAG: hypothetical protein H0U78_01660 [Rickettsiaceae bacterium]|nr:hypothetical protein [Rickettsiaceae bacterium]